MKKIKFPTITISDKKPKLNQQPSSDASLLNPLNEKKEILSYSIQQPNDHNEPKREFFNDNVSSLLFSPIQYLRKHRKNRLGYLVHKTRVPEISIVHSIILKQSILKSQTNYISKENSINEMFIDQQNHFEYPTIIKDPNRSLKGLSSNNNKENKIKEDKKEEKEPKSKTPLYNNSYRKKLINDPDISNLIADELFKASKHVYNRSRSQSTMANNCNAKRIFDKINIPNTIISNKIANKRLKNQMKPTRWPFIDINQTNKIKGKRIEISKYDNPYKVIRNINLMKKVYDKTMAYLPKEIPIHYSHYVYG